MTCLAGRSALVTGAAGGIGAAICRAFVAEGAVVTATDIDDEGGRALASELGPCATYAHLDVSMPGAWRQVVADAEARSGPLSILVNNAGIIGAGLIETLDPALWAQVLAINLGGTFLGMQAALPSLRRAGGGAIVNISSTAGIVGYPDRAAYVASKWGVRGLSKTAALEFARDNIRVNSVHPGPIRTALTAGYPDESWDAQPIPRFGEPAEVARMVVFIVAEASYSTASEFIVDGGIMAGAAR
ncbi:MAG: SDR family oxidoreductase [Sphingomonadaceae bacterium]|nr:SDR family oxidoreductase [Sphingomonadaceae bacterium]